VGRTTVARLRHAERHVRPLLTLRTFRRVFRELARRLAQSHDVSGHYLAARLPEIMHADRVRADGGSSAGSSSASPDVVQGGHRRRRCARIPPTTRTADRGSRRRLTSRAHWRTAGEETFVARQPKRATLPEDVSTTMAKHLVSFKTTLIGSCPRAPDMVHRMRQLAGRSTASSNGATPTTADYWASSPHRRRRRCREGQSTTERSTRGRGCRLPAFSTQVRTVRGQLAADGVKRTRMADEPFVSTHIHFWTSRSTACAGRLSPASVSEMTFDPSWTPPTGRTSSAPGGRHQLIGAVHVSCADPLPIPAMETAGVVFHLAAATGWPQAQVGRCDLDAADGGDDRRRAISPLFRRVRDPFSQTPRCHDRSTAMDARRGGASLEVRRHHTTSTSSTGWRHGGHRPYPPQSRLPPARAHARRVRGLEFGIHAVNGANVACKI
jgi:hypothetical protein